MARDRLSMKWKVETSPSRCRARIARPETRTVLDLVLFYVSRSLVSVIRKLLLIIATILHASFAMAAEQLAPEDSTFTGANLDSGSPSLSDYDTLLVSAFRSAFAKNVRARVIAIPSFQTEYAVSIQESAGVYSVVVLQSPARLWNYSILTGLKERSVGVLGQQSGQSAKAEIDRLQTELPSDYRDIKMSRCETPIAPDLGARILRVWRGALIQTRYNDAGRSTVGIDGDIYHFSMTDGEQHLAGQAWSPDESSDPGRLVRITVSMKSYCETRDPQALRLLEQQVNILLRRLRG
jgi:hypothetical protein